MGEREGWLKQDGWRHGCACCCCCCINGVCEWESRIGMGVEVERWRKRRRERGDAVRILAGISQEIKFGLWLGGKVDWS